MTPAQLAGIVAGEKIDRGLLKELRQRLQAPRQVKEKVDPNDLADESRRNSWIQDKGMKALNFHSETLPVGEIDIVINSPIPYKALKGRAVVFPLQEVKIHVASIHDLIELKLHAGRKQDLSDVEYLRIIMEK